jgi:hypothetical protein
MPVVFREDGLRYYFFSNEGTPREPPHIHVKGRGCDAKIWLEPDISIDDSYGFSEGAFGYPAVVADNRDRILRAWHEHFRNGRPL